MEDELLKQTIKKINKILGDEINNITVDRAVIGLFYSGVKLNV